MVGWRTVVGDAPQVDGWSEGDAVAFGRGDRGFVVVNAGDEELRTTLATSLPDGEYCDVLSTDDCAASAVRDGTITIVVPPRSAQAWDVSSRP
jgi:alpha-amylase